MASANANMLEQYRQPIWGRMDRALRNCFTASAILGLLVLIAVFVVPTPAPQPVSIEEMPERIARLILEKPKPAAPVLTAPEPVTVVETPKAKPPPRKVKPKRPPRPNSAKPKATPNQGVKGRHKAQKDVTQNLAQVTGSLDQALDNLSKSLKSTSDSGKERPKARRRRRVRSGRTSGQLSPVQDAASLSSADVSGSAIAGEGISIAAITDLVQGEPEGSAPEAGGASTGNGRGNRDELRSNESLLGVVRRYAPGIQFCYDNELKKNPGLRGKLVISLTVLANGKVSEAFAVVDNLGSPAVTRCVLAQVRGWQFPAIPRGATSFKTPFVFTPPD